MTYFNRMCSWSAQPVQDRSTVTIHPADLGKWAKVTRWLKWAIQIPVEIPRMLHTIGLMIKHREMIAPLQNQLVPGRAIHHIASPMGAQHIVTSDRIANVILRHYRNDEEGLFAFGENGINARLILPVVQDIVREPICLEDYLFTCHSVQAGIYRKVMLEFFGPQNLPALKDCLSEVVKSALAYLESQEADSTVYCSAKELAEMFTTAVVSNLLLGKKIENFANYQHIAQAVSICMKHAISKSAWIKPTPEKEQSYRKALKIVQDMIDSSEGDFVNALKQTAMTNAQRKGILFLMYVAGGETTSSLLEYMLWQLGQHPEFQTEILKPTDSFIDRFIQESLRLHPPTPFIFRTAKTDLEVHVENPDQSDWKYRIAQGQNILISPYFIGRNPLFYDDPNSFNPDRKKSGTNTPSSSNAFGRGPHGCPGKWLALDEIRMFIKSLLEHYEINSKPTDPPRQKQRVTMMLEPKIDLVLTKRKLSPKTA
jgi:cytochrome P450